MPIEFVEVAFGSDPYPALLELRRQILRQPLGLDFTAAEIAVEYHEFHLAAYESAQLVGCVLLRPIQAHALKLRQMAVVETVRGRGIGTQLVCHAEEFARARGFTQIEMHARKSAQAFYEKLGYTAIGGDFIEVTLPHIRMQKKLP